MYENISILDIIVHSINRADQGTCGHQDTLKRKRDLTNFGVDVRIDDFT